MRLFKFNVKLHIEGDRYFHAAGVMNASSQYALTQLFLTFAGVKAPSVGDTLDIEEYPQ